VTRRVAILALLAALVLTSLVPAATAAETALPFPDTMAAVGDSITRAASTGSILGADAPQNSWSTGTTTSVNSHYLRLLALGAPIGGQNHNRSVSGAKMGDLNAQMQTVIPLQPDYLTVLVGGNDVCTDTVGQMTTVATFRAQLETAIATLSAGSPGTHVYVVSIPNVYQLWNLFKNDFWARFIWSLANICQSLLANPTSTTTADVQRREAVRQRTVDYNTQLAQVCALYERCRFDGNAVFNSTFTTGDVSGDYFHPSITGQAKLASVAWNAGYTWATAPPPNQAPVAGLSTACTGLTCTFTDTSTDGDGTIVARSWNFGDGGTSTDAVAPHTYASAGTYTVGLTVTDDDGATASTSISVTVAPVAAPTMWVESLTSTTTTVHRNWTATVTVLVVDADGHGVPNATVSAAWSVGSPDTCTTDSVGTCAVASDTLNGRKVASVTLSVNAVTHATLAWDSTQGQNVISIARPT
jgi:PKD repeat protein